MHMALDNQSRMPTPAEIEAAILRKLTEDYRANPQGGPEPFIPMRASTIVREAIREACGNV